MSREPLAALLPMKAHSSRIAGKNFRLLGDRPLFRWILDTLLSIDEIAKIVINTDAREILSEHGVVTSERIMIRDRAPELCGDNVSMNRIIENDIGNVPADSYLMTHTTNPFLRADTIRRALRDYREAVKHGHADSLFSVNRHQTRFYLADATPVNHDPTNLIPTQDLEPWFEENSNLYLFSAASFARTHARIGAKPLLFATPKRESLDIDDPEDWTLAEALANGEQSG
jgi:CMP-N-acetylneuraminic acid synthetase